MIAPTQEGYDWTQDETEDALASRMVRASGDAICGVCGKPYYSHQLETRVVSFDGTPFLRRRCDGSLLKL